MIEFTVFLTHAFTPELTLMVIHGWRPLVPRHLSDRRSFHTGFFLSTFLSRRLLSPVSWSRVGLMCLGWRNAELFGTRFHASAHWSDNQTVGLNTRTDYIHRRKICNSNLYGVHADENVCDSGSGTQALTHTHTGETR